MPGTTGVELAARLRTAYPGMPVVLASGCTDLGAAQAESLGLPRLANPSARELTPPGRMLALFTKAPECQRH